MHQSGAGTTIPPVEAENSGVLHFVTGGRAVPIAIATKSI